MKKILGIVFLILLAGCTSGVDPEKLPLLNGYWEIEKVVFPDGSSKSYTVNTAVDFVQFEGREGYRKKVQPEIGGTYRTSDDAENFSVIEKSGQLIIQYINADITWEETLVSLSEDRFVVLNDAGISYHYKRYESLNIVP